MARKTKQAQINEFRDLIRLYFAASCHGYSNDTLRIQDRLGTLAGFDFDCPPSVEATIDALQKDRQGRPPWQSILPD